MLSFFVVGFLSGSTQLFDFCWFLCGIESAREEIEKSFRGFLSNPNISVIIVNQYVWLHPPWPLFIAGFACFWEQIAESYLRHLIDGHTEIFPCILEIPSKDRPYEPKKDAIMIKAARMLFGSESRLDE
jgi:V-type H+-transporting ATPase subunit F